MNSRADTNVSPIPRSNCLVLTPLLLSIQDIRIDSAYTTENTQGGHDGSGRCYRRVLSIGRVVINAGISSSKLFTEHTAEEIRAFVSINPEGFVMITQLALRQMPAQGSAGSATSISAALADNPLAAFPAPVPMMTRGDNDVIKPRLANEYATEKIRFNAATAGLVDTPVHKGNLKARSPIGTISEPKDVAGNVVYLTNAGHVAGEVLHMDDGAQVGQW